MDKKKVTKTVVDQLVGFGVATASYNIIRTNMPMTQYPAINIALKVSAFATGYMVGGMIHENHTRPYADLEIDKLFALIEHHTK